MINQDSFAKSTNLRVRGSNPFGRAIYPPEIVDDFDAKRHMRFVVQGNVRGTKVPEWREKSRKNPGRSSLTVHLRSTATTSHPASPTRRAKSLAAASVGRQNATTRPAGVILGLPRTPCGSAPKKIASRSASHSTMGRQGSFSRTTNPASRSFPAPVRSPLRLVMPQALALFAARVNLKAQP